LARAEFEEPEDDAFDDDSPWDARFPVHKAAVIGDVGMLRNLLSSGLRCARGRALYLERRLRSGWKESL
jgi:hypothetical protein